MCRRDQCSRVIFADGGHENKAPRRGEVLDVAIVSCFGGEHFPHKEGVLDFSLCC
jgi:hypothetical protein